MAVWYEGKIDIECTIDQVAAAFEDLGTHYTSVVRLMPGMTVVELVDQGPDSVTIKTNEGLMHRTNFSKTVTGEGVTVKYDEQYDAQSKVVATAHFSEEYSKSAAGVHHRLAITDMKAPGFLGFFYRRFGSSNIGKAFLDAHKTSLEANRG